MSLQLLLPVISKVLGRDISKEVDLFYRSRAAVGASLNPQGQQFFVENWHRIPDFMETTEGKVAIGEFMNAWVATLIPKTVAIPEEQLPPPTPQPVVQPEPVIEPRPPVEPPHSMQADTSNVYL